MKTAFRWIARLVFLVALLTWGRMAPRSTRQPESWRQTQRRSVVFVVMMAAGMAGFPLAKPELKGTRRRERF